MEASVLQAAGSWLPGVDVFKHNFAPPGQAWQRDSLAQPFDQIFGGEGV
jgi:hypothetical protein